MNHRKTGFLTDVGTLVLILTLSLIMPAVYAQVAILPGDGITFKQIDYAYDIPTLNSSAGLMVIDIESLTQATGVDTGWINVNLGGDWIVRNVPIYPQSDFPYSGFTTPFDLGVDPGEDVDAISISIQIGNDPVVSFPNDDPFLFSVGQTDEVLGGEGEGVEPAAPTPPTMNDVLFGDPNNTNAIIQFDHPNIEAANNQCLPASIANSLQFLENTTDLEIPHNNVMGLKGDDSLVGQLDTTINRTIHDPPAPGPGEDPLTDAQILEYRRRHGNPVGAGPGLNGKVRYMAANGLGDKVRTTHYHPDLGNGVVSQTVDETTVTSQGKGTLVTIVDIMDALKKGHDVEAGYLFPGGGHAIEIVAAGITSGVPWIVHASDVNQSSDSAGAGPAGFKFEYLTDPDGDGRYNLSGSNRELYRMFVQEYTEPPAPVTFDLTVIEIFDPLFHSCCVTPPPTQVDLFLNDGSMTMSDSVPWLPMTGDVTPDGTFALDSTTSVAGFPGIFNTFDGEFLGASHVDGAITLGANGGLFGEPIIFTVALTLPPGRVIEVSEDTVIAANETMTIAPGETLIIKNGATLTVNGMLINDGTVIVEQGGKMDNNALVSNNGTLDIDGILQNKAGAQLDNDGSLNNKENGQVVNGATMTNHSQATFSNAGDLNNEAKGTIYNAGTINNSGTATNPGSVYNVTGGTIVNASPNTIVNSGTIFNDVDCSILNTANGTFTNEVDGIINNEGVIESLGDFDNLGTINIGCLATITGIITGNSVVDTCDDGQ
jgi:hypothetical protein